MHDFSAGFVPEDQNLPGALEFVEEKLTLCKVNRKDRIKAMLLAEECIVGLFQCVQKDEHISIRVKKFLGKTTITITGKSLEKIRMNSLAPGIDPKDFESAPNAEAAIRSMIINANRDVLRESFRNGTNRIEITAGSSSQKNLMYVLFSMLLAAVICSLMRLVLPDYFNKIVNDYIFTAVKTVFFNVLKAVIGPLIFFSIAAAVSSITDLSEFGKTGVRVMVFYGATTLVSVIAALASYYLVDPGSFNEFSYMINEAEIVSDTGNVSILNTLLDIVPSNFFGAFVNSATLQLLFLGVLIGGVVPRMGDKTEKIAAFLSTANELFLRVTAVITKCMPVAVFAFVGSMVLTMDYAVIRSLPSLFLCILLGTGLIIAFYLAAVLIMTRTNPLTFLKNAAPACLNAFALSSSNASMPSTMNVCDKKLGISPKLYSFSIPLGTTVNLNGLVILLTTAFMFLSKVFGIELSGWDMGALILTITLLSLGCPGIPGSATICMSVLLMQFHVPMEALAVFVGISTIIDPLSTANNVLGNITGTFCIGKRSI